MSSPSDNYCARAMRAYCDADGKIPSYLQQYAKQVNLTLQQLGITENYPDCMACGGRAYVLVLQPAQRCGHCGGKGRHLQVRCLGCRGTGWMFVQKERVNF